MALATQVAHLNVARLRHPPADARVAGFIDNVPKVNAIAERSPGYVWRLSDEAPSVVEGVAYQGVAARSEARRFPVRVGIGRASLAVREQDCPWRLPAPPRGMVRTPGRAELRDLEA